MQPEPSAASPPPGSLPTLPPELAARLEPVCEAFALAWRAGGRPRLEDFLDRVGEPDRPTLLRALLALDVESRGRAGERPTAEEYRLRLPTYAALIDAAFAEQVSTAPEPAPATRARPDGGLTDSAVDSHTAATDGPAVARLPRAGRYEVEQKIAEGGMGEVWRARDPGLGQPLAIKILHAKYRGLPEPERRFVGEARITGQLQHPGIPPVHEVGTGADGRPFFAMKLVVGRTLEALLLGRASPADDLPRFLGIFEQVCQTLAYAHSEGVIHRDLKPSNVMIGAFGEVQVMDWGLAKRLAGRGLALPEGGGIAPGTDAPDPLATEAGAALGTPAYMAPEQARGEVGRLDERCDVFGLGGILCEILTGRAPFGGTAGEARRRSAAGDLDDTFASLGGCGADPQLVALARACLAPDWADRPPDAGTVAQAVAAYLAGVQERLREAERRRAVAEARAAEERKRRRLAIALAGSVLLLAGVASAGVWWYRHVEGERVRQRERTEREVKQALGEARILADQAHGLSGSPDRWEKTLGLALSALKRAEGFLGAAEVGSALRREVAELSRALADAERERKLLAAVDDIRLRLAELNDGQIDRAGLVRRFRGAFREHGIDVFASDPVEVARRVRGGRHAARVLAALKNWERTTEVGADRDRLARVARAADPDTGSLANRWREAYRVRDREALERLARQAEALRLTPVELDNLAQDLKAAGLLSAAERLLRGGLERHRGDFWLNFELAYTLSKMKPPNLDEAIRYYTAARALRARSGMVHVNLGAVLHEKGRWEEAVACYRTALDLDPRDSRALSNLGIAVQEKGQRERAITYFRRAVAADPTYAGAHYNLGDALWKKGERNAAVAAFRKAIAAEPRFALAHNNLGIVLREQGQHGEALTCFRRAIKLDPERAAFHFNLGIAYQDRKRWAQAVASYRKAVALEPANAAAHVNLGTVLRESGQTEAAVASFNKALGVDPRLAAAHYNLGNIRLAKGQRAEAMARFRKAIDCDAEYAPPYVSLGAALNFEGQRAEAIRLLRKAVTLEPGNALAHSVLGLALHTEGRHGEAIPHFRKAIAIEPGNALAHLALGNTFRALGRHDEAIASYRKAVAANPRLAEAHVNLGTCLRDQGDRDGAVAAFRNVVALQPEDPSAHVNLGMALLGKGRRAQAIACFRKAIELDPTSLSGYVGLGTAYEAHGRRADAIACFRTAVALRPGSALAHNMLGSVLQADGQREQAIACFRKAIELDPRLARAHHRLGIALREKGQEDEAITSLRRAVECDAKQPEYHADLGLALQQQGRFAEALEALRRGLGGLKPDDPRGSALRVAMRETDRLLEVDRKLDAIRLGRAEPSGDRERLDLALHCLKYKRRYAAAAGFYAQTLRTAPAGNEDQAGHRFHAARAALLASSGQGEDAGGLSDAARARLRKQTLGWLRAELAAWESCVRKGGLLARAATLLALTRWGQDADLASVRGPDALKKLTESERAAWRQLWEDVAGLRERVAGR